MISPAYPVRLLLAVLAYLALYVSGSNVAWAWRTSPSERLGQATKLIQNLGAQLFLGEAFRLAYYLGVPYLVLYHGWVGPLDMGLAGLDWISGLGVAAAFGTACLLVLFFVWWQYVRLVESRPAVQQAEWLRRPWGWGLIVREAVFLESCWALCRSPMLLLVGQYFGTYLGLGLVWAAALLSARTWNDLRVPGRREETVLSGSLAVVTATLYGFVHNLWLCIAVHVALRMLVLSLLASKAAPQDLSAGPSSI